MITKNYIQNSEKFSFHERRVLFEDKRVEVSLGTTVEKAFSSLLNSASRFLDASVGVVDKGLDMLDLGFAYGRVAFDKARIKFTAPEPPNYNLDCYDGVNLVFPAPSLFTSFENEGATVELDSDDTDDILDIESMMAHFGFMTYKLKQHAEFNSDLLRECAKVAGEISTSPVRDAHRRIAKMQDEEISKLEKSIRETSFRGDSPITVERATKLRSLIAARNESQKRSEISNMRFCPLIVMSAITSKNGGMTADELLNDTSVPKMERFTLDKNGPKIEITDMNLYAKFLSRYLKEYQLRFDVMKAQQESLAWNIKEREKNMLERYDRSDDDKAEYAEAVKKYDDEKLSADDLKKLAYYRKPLIQNALKKRLRETRKGILNKLNGEDGLLKDIAVVDMENSASVPGLGVFVPLYSVPPVEMTYDSVDPVDEDFPEIRDSPSPEGATSAPAETPPRSVDPIDLDFPDLPPGS